METFDKIKDRFKQNRNWRACGIQLSFAFELETESLLEKIYKLRTHFFFEDSYHMIFIEGVDRRLVFDALKELIHEYGIENDFNDALVSEANLLNCAIAEHARFDPNESYHELPTSLTYSNFV